MNGVKHGTDEKAAFDLNYWNSTAHLFGSRYRPPSTGSPCWSGEVYLFAVYDYALPPSQIAHNYACSFPPSLPTLRITVLVVSFDHA